MRIAEIKNVKKDKIYIIDIENEKYSLFEKTNGESILYFVKEFRSLKSALEYVGKEVK